MRFMMILAASFILQACAFGELPDFLDTRTRPPEYIPAYSPIYGPVYIEKPYSSNDQRRSSIQPLSTSGSVKPYQLTMKHPRSGEVVTCCPSKGSVENCARGYEHLGFERLKNMPFAVAQAIEIDGKPHALH